VFDNLREIFDKVGQSGSTIMNIRCVAGLGMTEFYADVQNEPAIYPLNALTVNVAGWARIYLRIYALVLIAQGRKNNQFFSVLLHHDAFNGFGV